MHSLSLAVALVLAVAAVAVMGQGLAADRVMPPLDTGFWSSWGSWSSCSATCGGGTRTRTRYCRGRFLPLATLDTLDPRVRRAVAPADASIIRPVPFYCFPGERDSQSQTCNSLPCSGTGSGDIITRPTNCRCPSEDRPGTAMVSCSCVRLDVGAAVDGSGSISPAEFQDMKEALRALLSDLQVAPSGDHVAIVLYSSSVTQAFALTGNRAILDSRVNSLSRPGALTRTDLAISRMADLLLPGRYRVPKIGVVFTDGRSTQKAATLEAAQDAKSRGVTMFAVGIGDNLDQAELDAIASSPSTVFRASSFADLKSNVVHAVAGRINAMATS